MATGDLHKISCRSVKWFQRYARGQTDAQTDGLIAILRTPYWGGVTTRNLSNVNIPENTAYIT